MRSLFLVVSLVLSICNFVYSDQTSESTQTQESISEPEGRSTFQASFFTGVGIDSFAAAELQQYLNPDESGEIEERFVAGFDFAYRLYGKSSDEGQQLWVYGETVHGVRSSDVDCEANPDLAVCEPFSDVISAGEKTLYILRNATSLEGLAGIRWEFSKLNPDSDSPAFVYLKAQAGFLTVTKGDDDLVDVNHGGIGLIAYKGRFEGSYVELGFGKSDLFITNPNKRFKIDGYLTWHPTWWEGRITPFAEITIDSDFGDGADSIQSYFGFDIDVDELLSKSKQSEE